MVHIPPGGQQDQEDCANNPYAPGCQPGQEGQPPPEGEGYAPPPEGDEAPPGMTASGGEGDTSTWW